jgi:hypothetical protein
MGEIALSGVKMTVCSAEAVLEQWVRSMVEDIEMNDVVTAAGRVSASRQWILGGPE